MKKKLIIKFFRGRKNSNFNNRKVKTIVVSFKNVRLNSIVKDKVGTLFVYNFEQKICFLNLFKIGFWMNKGAILKSKVYWLMGILAYNDIKLK